MNQPILINFNPRERECCACGQRVTDCHQAIPLHEGEPVSHAYTGQWGGFAACPDCYKAYTAYTACQADPVRLLEWWNKVKAKTYMKNSKTKGPTPMAFPCAGAEGVNPESLGMRLVDYYAGQALPIIINHHATTDCGGSGPNLCLGGRGLRHHPGGPGDRG